MERQVTPVFFDLWILKLRYSNVWLFRKDTWQIEAIIEVMDING